MKEQNLINETKSLMKDLSIFYHESLKEYYDLSFEAAKDSHLSYNADSYFQTKDFQRKKCKALISLSEYKSENFNDNSQYITIFYLNLGNVDTNLIQFKNEFRILKKSLKRIIANLEDEIKFKQEKGE